MIILSILIPSLNSRKRTLKKLLESIASQGYEEQIEVITDIDNGEITTGEKRNRLLAKANGIYSVFIDDDDNIVPDYLRAVLLAAKEDSDCITYHGYMTTNGTNRIDWIIKLGEKYEARKIKEKQLYFRFPNHIVPIKTSIAKKVKFPHKTIGEDIVWACGLNGHKHKHGQGVIYNTHKSLLKTSTHIPQDMYHYDFRTNKKNIN